MIFELVLHKLSNQNTGFIGYSVLIGHFCLSTRAKFMLEHFMIVSPGLNKILCYYLDIWGWFCCASCTQWKYSWFAYVYSLVMGHRSYNGCICGRGCVR